MDILAASPQLDHIVIPYHQELLGIIEAAISGSNNSENRTEISRISDHRVLRVLACAGVTQTPTLLTCYSTLVGTLLRDGHIDAVRAVVQQPCFPIASLFTVNRVLKKSVVSLAVELMARELLNEWVTLLRSKDDAVAEIHAIAQRSSTRKRDVDVDDNDDVVLDRHLLHDLARMQMHEAIAFFVGLGADPRVITSERGHVFQAALLDVNGLDALETFRSSCAYSIADDKHCS
jgi:hypothetical protein